MSTIKDIAAAAGVSRGTVSNVLNRKANVSSDKIKLVEDIVQNLGYKIDIRAKNLRQKKNYSVGVIIPDIKLRHYADFYVSLKNFLRNSGYIITLYTTDGGPDGERQAISQIIASKIDTIVTFTCLPNDDDAYNSVPDDISIIFVGRKVDCSKPRAFFASFDYRLAGIEIANYIVSHGFHKAVYFSDTHRFAQGNLMYNTMKDQLDKMNVSIRSLTSDNSLMINTAFEIYDKEDFDVIVTANIDRAQAILTVHNFMSDKPAPCIITLSPTYALDDNTFVRYQLNFKNLGLIVGRRIVENAVQKSPDCSDILLENEGIGYTPTISAVIKKDSEPLNILAPACDSIDVLHKILPNFTKKMGFGVNITTFQSNELYDVIKTLGDSGYYDLICMNVSWLPELGENVYIPIPQIVKPGDQNLFDNLFTEYRKDYSAVNRTSLCFPFDPGVLLLLYRSDIFENYKVKRTYYELYHEELTIPQSYEHFNRVARFFSRSFNHLSETEYGATLDYTSNSSAFFEFISRLIQQKSKKDQPDFPDEDQLRTALNLLKETYECCPKSLPASGKIADLFAQGDIAMCITMSGSCVDLVNSKNSNVSGKVGFAKIPGCKTLTDGNVIGFARNSIKAAHSLELIRWMFSNDIASAFSVLGGLSPCRNVYSNINITDLYPWLSITGECLKTSLHRQLKPKNYKCSEKHYENIMGITIKSILTNSMPLDEAVRYLKRTMEAMEK